MKDQILDKATDMFLTLGFKSVTMDDIASEMGISKKTIYQHFSNKDSLVKASTSNLFEKISCGIDDIILADKNPIEELFAIKDFVVQNLKDENTSPIYQLQKYYPRIHKSLTIKQFEKMGSCVVENLEKGISLGLFRKDIDKELISRFYFAGMTSIKDVEIFNPKNFRPREVQLKYLEYHLRGICTPKGIDVLTNIITNN
ncbi:TetR/AcrR family transcriptional regulator [Flavobacterium jejuense]|uniref:TetR/AcrR family transcriptional regulator n=1 Tax=Flavobacterium jejuense TaxID=1544455 RepID=A0ABX0IUV4_9FLAO|nr:TetR/AcrR family transcriptional regulator [Flavobacterium jejuense]NHN26971.1 TetR/AcrR family transcriptional regulator [Flavobacterium jejuense]